MVKVSSESIAIFNFKLFALLYCIRTFSVVSNHLDIALSSSILGHGENRCIQYGMMWCRKGSVHTEGETQGKDWEFSWRRTSESEVTTRNGSLKFLGRREEDGTQELFLFEYYENGCSQHAPDVVIPLADIRLEIDTEQRQQGHM